MAVTKGVVHRRLEFVMVSFNMDLFTVIKYVYFHRKHSTCLMFINRCGKQKQKTRF